MIRERAPGIAGIIGDGLIKRVEERLTIVQIHTGPIAAAIFIERLHERAWPSSIPRGA